MGLDTGDTGALVAKNLLVKGPSAWQLVPSMCSLGPFCMGLYWHVRRGSWAYVCRQAQLKAFVVQAVGFETEATAIIDTLNYIRPDIHTLVIGQVCSTSTHSRARHRQVCCCAALGFRLFVSTCTLTCAALRLQAFGNAAMLLASGKKGCRFALPHARIMTAPPRLNRSFGAAPNIMIKANELEYSTRVYTELLAKATGAPRLLATGQSCMRVC